MLPAASAWRRLLTYQTLQRGDPARFNGGGGANGAAAAAAAAGSGDEQQQQGQQQQGQQQAHRGFHLRKVDGARGGGPPAIVLTRVATPEAAAALEARLYEERVAAVRDAAGFSAVFELMRDSGKPAGAQLRLLMGRRGGD